jgi:hypothetical protein
MVPSTGVEGTRIASPGQAPREARLRPEHAHRYPGIRPEKWETAAVVADRVLAGWLLRGNDIAIRGRVLLDAHFEFRGGCERGGEREGARPQPELVARAAS